jgi:hypothetical protein
MSETPAHRGGLNVILPAGVDVLWVNVGADGGLVTGGRDSGVLEGPGSVWGAFCPVMAARVILSNSA